MKEQISKVFESNYHVYGARKIWRELNRQGRRVARCTVERLMRELGIAGAVRGKRVITTLPGGQAERAPDLLDRDFVASAPNRCWVADFTHVKTWAGVVSVAFVIDTFSRRTGARQGFSGRHCTPHLTHCPTREIISSGGPRRRCTFGTCVTSQAPGVLRGAVSAPGVCFLLATGCLPFPRLVWAPTPVSAPSAVSAQ